MARALIALGSNVGDRAQEMRAAMGALDALRAVRVVANSALHETAPIGGPPGQPPFLNAVAVLETTLAPTALHQNLHELERASGRVRNQRWGPRIIDLDLLLFDDEVIESAELEIPHPRMSFRRFVIEPAAEIAPQWVHPRIGWTIERLDRHLRDAPHSVAFTGLPGSGTDQLAANVIEEISASGAPVPQIQAHWPAADRLRREMLGLPDEPSTAIEQSPPQKLLVLLDPPLDHAPSVARHANEAFLRLFRSRLVERAFGGDVGPVLWLRNDNLQQQTAETVAAIAAMQ